MVRECRTTHKSIRTSNVLANRARGRVLRLRIEMQANVLNLGRAKIRNGRLVWHLMTDMDNQFLEMIDVFPPAKILEKAENNMVAVIKVPDLCPGENFSPTVILRIDTTTRDWLIEQQSFTNLVKIQNRGRYCSLQKYWEIDNPLIQQLSQSIAERSDSDTKYAKLAYQVVRDTLKLKTLMGERKGAAWAASEKEGDCDEHADLFIALARAVRIPSRRVVGHYFKGGPEPEPHAWSEVFLENLGWIPVDAALGNFGVLTENYFSRIREGLVSRRDTVQFKVKLTGSESLQLDETVHMTVLRNGQT